MGRRTVFISYQPKTILNRAKRADHWFWSRYSAYPYIGCQHGCAFCYCRERRYSPYDDPRDFAYQIKIKENAPELLERALRRVPADVVFTGDYQPAERKFGISRRMLEVCRDLAFPVFVLERSPLVVRDLGLLREIHERAGAIMAFSIISAGDAPGAERVRRIENLAPAAEKRFAAMEKFAAAGITTGTCAMPLLPELCDDEATLELLVRQTREHGGQFVLAGGLTLADQQRDFFMGVLHGELPDMAARYEELYTPGSYGPRPDAWRPIARRVRELCTQFGLRDRVPRPVIPGDKRALNKRLVEWLANEAYTLDLAGDTRGMWEYRKAAWAIEDLPQDVGLVRRTLGVRGLAGVPGIGEKMAGRVEEWVKGKDAGDG
jgi:DNA repair photolyase